MDLYSITFLDHAKNPRNVGVLKNPTHIASMENTSCGDSTKIYLEIRNLKLEIIKHETVGCMVATFSTSVLSEKLIGKTVNEVLKTTPEDLLKLLQVELSMSRLKCAMLPLMAIQKALKNDKN
jgi:NifU-like protein involved in Fe-S cluster formation